MLLETSVMDSTHTPCIGFCSTTYGDDYCRGCYRDVYQVLGWRQLEHDARALYYQQISSLTYNFFHGKVAVTDPDLFHKACHRFSVEIQEGLNDFYYLLRLMQKGALAALGPDIGLTKLSELSWSELYRSCDRFIYSERNAVPL